MHKKPFLTGLSVTLLAGISAAVATDDSLVLLNTNKTIEETKPKSLTKIEPSRNITDVFSTPVQKETEI